MVNLLRVKFLRFKFLWVKFLRFKFLWVKFLGSNCPGSNALWARLKAERASLCSIADGVINRDSDDYIKNPAEWLPLPGSLDAIAALHRAGWPVVIASNQSGTRPRPV